MLKFKAGGVARENAGALSPEKEATCATRVKGQHVLPALNSLGKLACGATTLKIAIIHSFFEEAGEGQGGG
jgi:hypothetical protein